MTDLRKASHMALHALEFSLPAIEDFGSKEQLTDCHRAIMALYKSLAQPDETETLKRCLFQMQEAAKALAQPEHPLDKKADNARELGLDYEPDMSTNQQNVYTSEKRVQKSDKSVHEPVNGYTTSQVNGYTAPPRKEWVGLTDDDMHTIRDDAFVKNVDDIEWALQMVRRIEAKLKERNT